MTKELSNVLADGTFEPITRSIGFLRVPLDQAASGLQKWRDSIHQAVTIRTLRGPVSEQLAELLPLTLRVVARELLIEHGEWTAYFGSGARGTDTLAPMSVLSQDLGCQSVAIEVRPFSQTGGSAQFTMFGPLRTGFVNYVRSISLVRDGGRWHWNTDGTPQWFEDLDAYKNLDVSQRFGARQIELYCAALGILPFEDVAYGQEGVLVDSHQAVPTENQLTLEQARQL